MRRARQLGNIALDGTKIAANASKHKALSCEHANRIEAQLRQEVQMLLKLVSATGAIRPLRSRRNPASTQSAIA
jgi:hypothetical protein